MRLSVRFQLLFWGFVLSASAGVAQNYDRHPDLPFSPVSLDWTINMDAEYGGFDATATYTFQTHRSEASQIVLKHRDLEILSVKTGETELPFVYAPDAVTVTFDQTPEKGTDFELAIEYRAYPAYGFFIENDGSVWTSGMTGALESVLPHMDHPRHQVRTQIALEHDAAYQAVANGTFVSRSTPDGGRVTTLFRSRVPLPLSGLRFAVGNYTVSEVKSGAVPVRIYRSALVDESVSASALRSLAASELERASAELKAPYPFEALTLVVQPFSYAESWGDAAGMAWLFTDYGAADEQAKLAVASQWFGQGLRGLSNRDRYYLSGYARSLAQAEAAFSSEVADLAGLDIGIDVRSLMAQENGGMPLDEFGMADARALLSALPGIVGTEELEDARYLAEMRPRNLNLPMNIPARSIQGVSQEAEGGFRFRFTRTDNPEILKLEIVPDGMLEQREYVAELREQYVDTTYIQPIRFEETGGEVELSVDPGLLNVMLIADGARTVAIEKPLGFWLYQIRNAAEQSDRVAAANALGEFSSDPDLRLVIRDLERSETDPAVRAALIVSLAANGIEVASMTGYKAMLEGEAPELRLAAVKALSNYSGDSVAVSLLRSHFGKASSKDERDAVMQSLQRISGPEESAAFIDEFLSAGNVDPGYLLQALFDEGSIDQGIAMADSLIGRGQAYGLRMQGLSLLEKFDDSPSSWQQRLPRLASDQDPRIRLKAIELTYLLDQQQREILIRDRNVKESDPRVRSRLTPL